VHDAAPFQQDLHYVFFPSGVRYPPDRGGLSELPEIEKKYGTTTIHCFQFYNDILLLEIATGIDY